MNSLSGIRQGAVALAPTAGFNHCKASRIPHALSTRHELRRTFKISNNLKIRSNPRGMMVQANYGEQWSTPQDAYLTVGLAHCFEKTDDGKVVDRLVIEPISANSLECMANGARTCFTHVFGTTLGDVLGRNRSALPQEFEGGIFCEDFAVRAEACARTWMRPHAVDNLLDLVPLNQVKSGYNYDTTDKRVLNMDNVVNDEDNIKQDISIDVYGRKEKADLQQHQEQEEEVVDGDQEEDELDSLLAS